MTPQKISSMILCVVILYLITPINAYASMTKIFSIFEALMPPAILWAVFVTVWYLAVATVASRHGDAIGGIPPLPRALLTLLCIAALSLTMIGPAGIIYLLLYYPVVTAKAFLPAKNSSVSPALATALKRISLFAMLVLVGLIASSIYIHSHRSKDEFHQMLSTPRPSQHQAIKKQS